MGLVETDKILKSPTKSADRKNASSIVSTTMDDKKTETLPPIDPNPGWKPHQEHKRTIVEKKSEKDETESPEESRTPHPLPFGKLDVFA